MKIVVVLHVKLLLFRSVIMNEFQVLFWITLVLAILGLLQWWWCLLFLGASWFVGLITYKDGINRAAEIQRIIDRENDRNKK